MMANMGGEIQAVPSVYGGVEFRSRLEARWAVFFDAIGVEWYYEFEGYKLRSGWYLPDFYLPSVNNPDKHSPVYDHPQAFYTRGLHVEIKHPNYFKESGWDDRWFEFGQAGYSLGVICGMPKKAFRGGDSIYIDCKRGGGEDYDYEFQFCPYCRNKVGFHHRGQDKRVCGWHDKNDSVPPHPNEDIRITNVLSKALSHRFS